jgi:Kef-type K+ transport system membrane component KefB
MVLLSSIWETTLPIENPVLRFMVVLVIVLFAPLLLNTIKIPPLLGLIIAGAVIGPFGINLIERDSSIIVNGTAGLLYIMFLAGLEMDMADFKKNRKRSVIFGLYTFSVPLILGFLAGKYLLGFSTLSSILMASIYSSHTLLTYPMISKIGITKNRAVNIAVGGTILTDTLALLVLAAIVGLATGEAGSGFWIRLSLSVLIFGAAVLTLFPIIGRWFLKKYDDAVAQYIFVLAMVYLSAVMAEMAGIEAIIGAFLAGLALNRLIPHTSPLMNRVNFVGNAIFIPFFLISVGMLIDIRAFVQDFESIKVALVITVSAIFAKYSAAYLTQRTLKFTVDERNLIFGLSNAHVAAALAVVLVGHSIILNQPAIDAAALLGQVVLPERLLNDSVLNGTILLILVSCTVASFVSQRAANGIALAENDNFSDEKDPTDERILIPLSNAANVDALVNLGNTIRAKRNTDGLYALSIVHATHENASEKRAQKLLDQAALAASASDVKLNALLRYDVDVVNGIAAIIREHRISDLILGLHEAQGANDTFFGKFTENLLAKTNVTTLICKPKQPLATLKRHIVVVPEKAEREIGFPFWLIKVWNMARNTGATIVFYGEEKTLAYLKDVNDNYPIPAEFHPFSNWENLEELTPKVAVNDNLIVVMSRRDGPSYNTGMARIPAFLTQNFAKNNFLIIYPMQELGNLILRNPSMLEPIESLDQIGKTIANLFRRK